MQAFEIYTKLKLDFPDSPSRNVAKRRVIHSLTYDRSKNLVRMHLLTTESERLAEFIQLTRLTERTKYTVHLFATNFWFDTYDIVSHEDERWTFAIDQLYAADPKIMAESF